MSLTFDATLKNLAREDPRDFLIAFDQPTNDPLEVLNVDLSTVTTAADLVIGLGRPLREIVHIDFQSSARMRRNIWICSCTTLCCTDCTNCQSTAKSFCCVRKRPTQM